MPKIKLYKRTLLIQHTASLSIGDEIISEHSVALHIFAIQLACFNS